MEENNTKPKKKLEVNFSRIGFIFAVAAIILPDLSFFGLFALIFSIIGIRGKYQDQKSRILAIIGIIIGTIFSLLFITAIVMDYFYGGVW